MGTLSLLSVLPLLYGKVFGKETIQYIEKCRKSSNNKLDIPCSVFKKKTKSKSTKSLKIGKTYKTTLGQTKVVNI
jgi:hypothetical protein